MPGPFDLTKWTPTARLFAPINQRCAGLVQSPDQSLVIVPGVQLNTFFNDGAGLEWETGWQGISYDVMRSWATVFDTTTAQPPGGYAQSDGRVTSYFTIRQSSTIRYFYRFLVKFGRSTTADNGTLGLGHVRLEQSVDGTAWWPIQTFYTWPQINKGVVGGSGKASHFFQAGHARIPGSGPNGANADWLLMNIFVKSPPSDIPHNQVAMWRSDDFGSSWTFVRDVANTGPWLDGDRDIGTFLRASSGRLVAGPAAGLPVAFSDNLGVTWAAAGGGGDATGFGNLEFCGGGTMVAIRPHSAGGGGRIHLSCDDGGTWVQGFGGFPSTGQTTIATAMVGVQEHFVLNPVAVGGPFESWYSDTGGESYVKTGEIAGGSVFQGEPRGILARDPISKEYMVITSTGFTMTTLQQAPGGFAARTQCPLASAKIGLARPLVQCGATIVPDKCEG